MRGSLVEFWRENEDFDGYLGPRGKQALTCRRQPLSRESVHRPRRSRRLGRRAVAAAWLRADFRAMHAGQTGSAHERGVDGRERTRPELPRSEHAHGFQTSPSLERACGWGDRVAGLERTSGGALDEPRLCSLHPVFRYTHGVRIAAARGGRERGGTGYFEIPKLRCASEMQSFAKRRGNNP